MRRLVVPVMQAGTLDEDFELAAGVRRVETDQLEFELNDWDRFSLEAALSIRDGLGEAQAEVVVVTVGDHEVEEALVACLARGADRAIRVWDDDLVEVDALGVARVLAGVLREEPADLVLCGVQSADGASGATGAALAGLLDLPHAAVVIAIEYDAVAGAVTVERELEGGLIEQVLLPAPAVVTIQTGANEPRYATLRAIKQAASKPLDTVTLADLGLDVAAVSGAQGARVVGLGLPARGGRQATIFDGDVDSIATRILEVIGELVSEKKGALV